MELILYGQISGHHGQQPCGVQHGTPRIQSRGPKVLGYVKSSGKSHVEQRSILTPVSPDWTIEELAIYDIPAMIDFVCEVTGYEKVGMQRTRVLLITLTSAHLDNATRPLTGRWVSIHCTGARHATRHWREAIRLHRPIPRSLRRASHDVVALHNAGQV